MGKTDSCYRPRTALAEKGDFLVLDRQQLGRVMDCAVAIVVVANRAIEHVVAEDAVECFNLRRRRFG